MNADDALSDGCSALLFCTASGNEAPLHGCVCSCHHSMQVLRPAIAAASSLREAEGSRDAQASSILPAMLAAAALQKSQTAERRLPTQLCGAIPPAVPMAGCTLLRI